MRQVCGCYIKRKSVSLYLLLPCIFRVSENMQGNCNVDRTHRSSCASRVAPKVCAGTFGQILIQSGWVLLLYQSIPSGRLGWISHHCRAEGVLSHDQNTARGHDSSRAWQTINQTMPRIVPIALYIGSMLLLLLLLWEGSTTEPGGTMRWFDPSLMSWWPSLRVEMKLFWWPIEDQHCSDSGGCDECWFVCILTGPKRK